jgi:hypothetical protein
LQLKWRRKHQRLSSFLLTKSSHYKRN